MGIAEFRRRLRQRQGIAWEASPRLQMGQLDHLELSVARPERRRAPRTSAEGLATHDARLRVGLYASPSG